MSPTCSPPPPPTSGTGCGPHQPSRVPGARAGSGCGTVGPAALGWWPHSFLPAVPPALPAGSHLSLLPRLYELASPLAPGCTAAACLSLPIAFKNPLTPSRGPGPPNAGHGRAASQASGLGKSRCRWEVRAGAPQTRAPGAHRRQLPRRGTARLGTVPVAPRRRRDAALIRSRSRNGDGHKTPRVVHPPGIATIPFAPGGGSYLGLGEPQLGRQLGTLRQRQVLGLLETLVESLQLQAGVDGARLAQLLPFAVDAQFPVGDGRGLLVFLGWERSRELN